MIEPVTRAIRFASTGEFFEASIVSLTPEMTEIAMAIDWWTHEDLKDEFDPQPIDRFWNWNNLSIDFDGRPLASEKVALVTGDNVIQAAMMISTDPVESLTAPGKLALFVELLFAAPHNRPALRKDGQSYFLGSGSQLLRWGTWLSRSKGHEGRLRLDGSPDFLDWYEKRGLQRLGLEPIVFEGVRYTPMELPAPAAEKLLEDW